MKKALFICFLSAVLFIQNVYSQVLGDLFTENNAGFSMSMPSGWQTIDANQKYLMIIGPAENGLTPNIGFGDEDYSGAIPEYLDAVFSLLGQFYSELKLISRGNFSVNANITGGYITFNGRMGEISVRQKMYVFPNQNKSGVVLITCTAPQVNGEKYDSIFDACVKTFKWTR